MFTTGEAAYILGLVDLGCPGLGNDRPTNIECVFVSVWRLEGVVFTIS